VADVTQAAPVEASFRFAAPWWAILVFAGVSALLVVLGWGLCVVAEGLFDVSWWLVLPAFTVGVLGGSLALCGVIGLWLAVWCALTRAVGRRVIRVAPDGLWVWRPFGWWSVFVPFASVAWVKREQTERGGDGVWIVHGPDLRTETVGKPALRSADYDALLALLADRCPGAFTPDPPAGWRPPSD
jgi:hypothetical protein